MAGTLTDEDYVVVDVARITSSRSTDSLVKSEGRSYHADLGSTHTKMLAIGAQTT